MVERISGESLWMIVSIAIIVAIMIIVLALLAGLGPEGVFDLFQGIMATIAMYLVTQLHMILR